MALYGLQQDRESTTALTPVFFSTLASQLIEALCSATASPIEALENELSRVISRVLKDVHPDVIDVIQGRQRSGAAADAYALGQIGFAHQLAASAAHSRIDESFLDALKATKFSVYLEELYKGERTNKQLKNISHHTDENVSRRMKELRDEGITDFRKDGTQVFNFLTPVARQIMEAQKEQADEIHREYLEPHAPVVQAALDSLVEKQPIPDHMKSISTFDPVS